MKEIKTLKMENFLKKYKFLHRFLPQNPNSDLISQYRNKYILIDGDKGAGKTSFKTALLAIFYQNNAHREHEFIKYKLYDLIRRGFFRKKEYKNVDILKVNQELYSKGLRTLEPEDYCDIDIDIYNPPHAIYDTEYSVLSFDNEQPTELTHDLDFGQIRMPNNKKKYKTFLPYAVIASSEDIDLDNNSKQDQLDKSKYEWNKKQRHPGYTQIAETQYGETVAKWQRRSVDVLIYIKRRGSVLRWCLNNQNPDYEAGETKHKKCLKSTWDIWIYDGQRIVQKCGYDHLSPLTEKERSMALKTPTEELILRGQIRTARIVFNGNINKYYDSSACEGEFYACFKGFNVDERTSLSPNYTCSDIETRFQKRNAEDKTDTKKANKEK